MMTSFFSNLPEKRTCLAALDKVMVNEPFLCSIHWKDGREYIHRIIANIYFNNKKKVATDLVHKNNVVTFKIRQREK